MNKEMATWGKILQNSLTLRQFPSYSVAFLYTDCLTMKLFIRFADSQTSTKAKFVELKVLK